MSTKKTPWSLALDDIAIEMIAYNVVPATATTANGYLLPIFTKVQFSHHDGGMWATGTDRYKMARTRIGDADDTAPEILVPAAWFSQLLSLFKLRDRNLNIDLTATVTLADDTVTLTARGMPKSRAMGQQPFTITYSEPAYDGEFPKIAHLMEPRLRTEGEFKTNAIVFPPATMRNADGSRGFFVVPPDAKNGTYTVEAEDGSWSWVGMPMRAAAARKVPAAAVEAVSA